MFSTLRHAAFAALLSVVMTGSFTPVSQAASPDFYGIKMNSENHARDISPDELSLFPVHRGFDKNIYAYAHLDVRLNHTRSINFNIFNNTDNDLMTEKSFREYYIVLRNGERYRLNEPGMTMTRDQIPARGSGSLRADFGSLNVTKEQIEMVVCSFDMGKVKIVLLPIAQDPPPPLPKEAAKKHTHPEIEKDPVTVYPEDKFPSQLRGENEIKRAGQKQGGRFPVMDLPIFSWLKNASSQPVVEAKPVKPRSAAKTNVSSKLSEEPAPLKSLAGESKKEAAPLTKPVENKASFETITEPEKKSQRKGLFGSLFSVFSGSSQKSSVKPAFKSDSSGSQQTTSSKTASDKEFFWKPRDLEPIKPIDLTDTKKADKKTRREDKVQSKKKGDVDKQIAEVKLPRDEGAAPKAFYMRRILDDSVKIPHDEPVTAVSSPQSKSKAPVLKPEKKLRRITPRNDAKVAQVNRQLGFVIVNAGSADGLKENMVINIYQRGKVIAKAVIRKMTEDAAAAMLMKDWVRADVAVGDPVSFY